MLPLRAKYKADLRMLWEHLQLCAQRESQVQPYRVQQSRALRDRAKAHHHHLALRLLFLLELIISTCREQRRLL